MVSFRSNKRLLQSRKDVAGLIGAEQNQGMKRTLLFTLALAVIPVGVDAQVPGDNRGELI